MKLITFLMALLILVLSVLPCADEAWAGSANGSKTAITKAAHKQDVHEDVCSPFCMCSCCAGISLFCQVQHTEFSLSLPKPVYVSFPEAPLMRIPLPIWRPPLPKRFSC